MDPIQLIIALILGTVGGTITGLVPGLHANTLIALAALAPWNPFFAYVLVSIAVVHTFVTILPNLYLAVPDEDTGLAVLPGHQMLQDGKSRLAVRISVDASLLAILVVVMLAFPLKWILLEPIRLLDFADRWGAWLLLLIALWLITREATARKQLWAVAIWLTAGGMGLVSGAHMGPLGFSQSPLLALLGGMFGMAGLLWSLQGNRGDVWQDRELVLPPSRPLLLGTYTGIFASCITALLPGVTAAVATSFSHQRDAPRAIATLSAVNTAHATLVLLILFATIRSRSALAMHVAPLATRWESLVPTNLLWMLALILLSGCAAWFVTLALDRPMHRNIHRIPAKRMSLAAAGILIAIVATLGGWVSLLLLAAATCLGWCALAAGIRRVHLIGVLVIPVLYAQWGS